MEKELALVKEFHKKFRVPIANRPTLIPENRSTLRYRIIKEEVDEYQEGIEKNDLENIAKELTDILYATYGTILEHGPQDKMEEIFAEVHRSNMSKEYHPDKVQKGANFSPADLGKILQDK